MGLTHLLTRLWARTSCMVFRTLWVCWGHPGFWQHLSRSFALEALSASAPSKMQNGRSPRLLQPPRGVSFASLNLPVSQQACPVCAWSCCVSRSCDLWLLDNVAYSSPGKIWPLKKKALSRCPKFSGRCLTFPPVSEDVVTVEPQFVYDSAVGMEVWFGDTCGG